METGSRLDSDVHERIYQQIAEDYLPRSRPQGVPVAIITGGQPGAGKSKLTAESKAELAAVGGYVLIDADRLRTWHPEYRRLMRPDDRTAANKTQADAGAWAGRLARESVASMRNIVFDQTSKDPVALGALADRLHAAGYTVRLHVMAVHERISEQRIYSRYEEQKANTGHGRFSTKENHDLAHAGVLAAVEAAEGRRLVDGIRVYDKEHRLLYDNSLRAGEWVKPPAAAATMRAERERLPSAAERAELLRGYDRLAEMVAVGALRATPAEREAIGALRRRADFERLAEEFRSGQSSARLAGAEALLKAVEQKARAESSDPRLVGAIVREAREVLAARIARGDMPSGPARSAPARTQNPELKPDRGLER